MPFTDNTPTCQEEAERLAGSLLIAAAITMQTAYKRHVSASFPPASKPGEYPRWRTGTGREATGYDPEAPDEAGRARAVRVGWGKSGDHMGILEYFRGRKGLRDVGQELRGQLQAILDQVPK